MTVSLMVVLAIVFATLLLIALLLAGSAGGGDRGRNLVGQIERYGPRHAPAPAGPESGKGAAHTAVGVASQVLRTSNAEQGLARRLDLAGIKRNPAEWALLGLCGTLGLTALLALLLRNPLLGVLAGVPLGWLGMRLAVSYRIRRRRAAFADQLPDVLQLIAGSLRSGFSLLQALDAVVREDSQPASDEFFRALAEARVGVDLGVALDGVANRMGSDDLRWSVMAIRIQREVGGNLAEILARTVATMRERAGLHRQVRALSAEGRLSAWILIALPVLMGGWLLLTDRAYLRPLYTSALGVAMLVIAAVLFVVGVLWMRAAVKVEV